MGFETNTFGFGSAASSGPPPPSAGGTLDLSSANFQESGPAQSGYVLNTNIINFFINGIGAGPGQGAQVTTLFVVPKDYVSGGQMNVEIQKAAAITNLLMTAYPSGAADSNINNVDIEPVGIGAYETVSVAFGDVLTPGQVVGVTINFQGAAGRDILLRRLFFNYD
jgi:hypothetical protein